MLKEDFIKKIIQNHKEIINIVEKVNPKVIINAKLKNKEDKKYTFSVIKSSCKIKIANLIEQKIYVKSKNVKYEGTVIDTYEGFIVVYCKKFIESKEDFILTIHANYNNEILMEKAEKFLSTKEMNKFIYESYESKESINLFINNSKPINYFDQNLNESQKIAVLNSLNSDIPFKILGPPGTGKTQTIVEIIAQYLINNKKVLVCGPSNISIDNIITRFLNSKFSLQNEIKFYRLGSSQKGLVEYNLENMAEKAVEFMKKEKDEKDFFKEKYKKKCEFINELKKESPVVFSTLFSSLKENYIFDLCIVDEACQATELECLMGILKGKNFILVGDPNQLSAMNSTTSLYEKLNLKTIVLNEQYRMHSDLLEFSNSKFYKNLIISKKQDDFMFFNQSKILFIDSSYFGYEEKNVEESKMNAKEGELIADVVNYITREFKISDPRSIGVIVPYSAQVLYLRDKINCVVETVDGFQGNEKDFIVIGLVRSNLDNNIGFLENERRMNVALTRCKKGMVIVGDASTFRKSGFFSSLFKFLECNAYVLDPETFYSLLKN